MTLSRSWHNTGQFSSHTYIHSVHMDEQVDGLCKPGSTLPKLTDYELLQHGTILLIARHYLAHDLICTWLNCNARLPGDIIISVF